VSFVLNDARHEMGEIWGYHFSVVYQNKQDYDGLTKFKPWCLEHFAHLVRETLRLGYREVVHRKGIVLIAAYWRGILISA